MCALVGTLKLGLPFLVAYAVYIALTRLVVALVLFTYSARVDLDYTWCLYANQLLNSVVKLYMIWRLPKQRWLNRGNQRSGGSTSDLVGQARELMAGYLTVFSVLALLLFALLATGTLEAPSLTLMSAVYAGWAGSAR